MYTDYNYAYSNPNRHHFVQDNLRNHRSVYLNPIRDQYVQEHPDNYAMPAMQPVPYYGGAVQIPDLLNTQNALYNTLNSVPAASPASGYLDMFPGVRDGINVIETVGTNRDFGQGKVRRPPFVSDAELQFYLNTLRTTPQQVRQPQGIDVSELNNVRNNLRHRPRSSRQFRELRGRVRDAPSSFLM